MMIKGREKVIPVPAHSLLFSKSTKGAARLNIPIGRSSTALSYQPFSNIPLFIPSPSPGVYTLDMGNLAFLGSLVTSPLGWGLRDRLTASSRENHHVHKGQDIASDASGRGAVSDAGLQPQLGTAATPLASDSSFLMTRGNTSSYLIVKHTDEGQSFQIQKGLDAIAGPVQNCMQMHNGCLHVETSSAVQ